MAERKASLEKADWAWIVLALCTVGWWWMVGRHWWWRSVLLGALSSASFMTGCLIGFLFTSYGEETGTVGKVRDWLIGGITGLTIAKAGKLRDLLLLFSSGNSSAELALTIGVSVVYSGLGFFFMFFQRELIFNVLLAEGRAERGRVEGTRQAGLVTFQLSSALPASVLAGIEDVSEALKKRTADAEGLEKILYSDDVERFLSQSGAALKSGGLLDWDVVSKVANLQYYRTYFVKGDDRPSQLQLAAEWIVRALVMNPLHMDLSVKYADVLGMLDRNAEAVSLLEKLSLAPECPAFVDQWLGYYLLFLPGRQDDSIRYSKNYLVRFPMVNESVRNIACAYAQKFCAEHKRLTALQGSQSQDYAFAIEYLKKALAAEPDYAETVKTKWAAPGGSFECFAGDRQFRDILDRYLQSKTGPEAEPEARVYPVIRLFRALGIRRLSGS